MRRTFLAVFLLGCFRTPTSPVPGADTDTLMERILLGTSRECRALTHVGGHMSFSSLAGPLPSPKMATRENVDALPPQSSLSLVAMHTCSCQIILSLSLLRGNKEKREPESIATAVHEGPHDSNGCPLRMKPSSAIWRLASSTGSVRQQPLSALSIHDPPYRACPPFIRVVPGPIME